jgi:hypothetical protein
VLGQGCAAALSAAGAVGELKGLAVGAAVVAWLRNGQDDGEAALVPFFAREVAEYDQMGVGVVLVELTCLADLHIGSGVHLPEAAVDLHCRVQISARQHPDVVDALRGRVFGAVLRG